MNRQDIADHFGLTIETLAHTVTKLASRNIVIPEGRHDLRNVNLARWYGYRATLMIFPRISVRG
jgi:CRP/FNR family transcriptional regulator